MLILECCSPHRAAKQFCRLPNGDWDKLSDYDAGAWFSVDQWEAQSLNDIADLVAGLRPLRTHYVVRVRLNAVGRALVSARRRIRHCHTTGTIPDPPIEDCSCNLADRNIHRASS
jgi:hypothetical protein